MLASTSLPRQTNGLRMSHTFSHLYTGPWTCFEEEGTRAHPGQRMMLMRQVGRYFGTRTGGWMTCAIGEAIS